MRQAVTRRWWEQERHKYDLFVSEAVENECRRGDPLQARKRLGVIEEASMLPLNRHNGTGGEVGNSWWVAGGRRRGCGAHSGCHGLSDRLLGNLEYSHIANAQIRRITEGILEDNAYRRPIICTPEELFGVDALEG